MLRIAAAALIVALPTVGLSQVTGTYTAPNNQGSTVTLQLQEQGGQVRGTIAAMGNVFQIQGQSQAGGFRGTATSQIGTLYIQGQLDGPNMRLVLAELTGDGQPNPDASQEILFTRSGGGPVGGGGSGSGGGAMGAPSGGGDPYSGTFVGSGLQVTLTRNGGAYTGTAVYEGSPLPVQAYLEGNRLVGQAVVDGQPVPFQAVVEGNRMTLATSEQTFQLQRSGGMAGGGMGGGAMGGGMGGGAAGTAGGAVAAGPGDQQLARLLLSSSWCTRSYNTSGSVSTSSNEQITFRPDGTVYVRSASRSSYSDPSMSGVVSGDPSVQEYRWRVAGGQLQFSNDGMAWETTPVQVQGSVIQAGGKRYTACR